VLLALVLLLVLPLVLLPPVSVRHVPLARARPALVLVRAVPLSADPTRLALARVFPAARRGVKPVLLRQVLPTDLVLLRRAQTRDLELRTPRYPGLRAQVRWFLVHRAVLRFLVDRV
jgi:hypothetical protein